MDNQHRSRHSFSPAFFAAFLLILLVIPYGSHVARVQGEGQTNLSVNLPCEQGFSDEFDASQLNECWTWIDPLNDAPYSLTARPGFLQISTTAATGNNVWALSESNQNGPRLLQTVHGNFTVETAIDFVPTSNYQGAGILVWQDTNNLLRLEQAVGGYGVSVLGITFAKVDNGVGSTVVIPPDMPNQLARVELRLQRTGTQFDAWWRAPSGIWQSAGSTILTTTQAISVGLLMVAEHGVPPTLAQFDYFRIVCDTYGPLTSFKAASKSQISPGEPLTYTIVLGNANVADVPNASITDSIPLSLTYSLDSLSATSGSYGYDSGVITWTGAVSAGTSVSVTFGVRTDPGLPGEMLITNTALINDGVSEFARQATFRTFRAVYLPVCFYNLCTKPVVDDFSDTTSGWPIAETDDWSYGYWGGTYRFYAHAPAFGAVSRGDRQTGPLTIEVDMRQASSVIGTMGIVAGLNSDWSDFYTFELFPAIQEYTVYHFSNGQWSLWSHKPSTAIQPVPHTNRLRLVLGDSTALIIINGIWVESLSWPPYDQTAGRRVGLTATGDDVGFEVRFDNYKLVPEGCPENLESTQQLESPTAIFETVR